MPVAGGGWFRLLTTGRVVKAAKSCDEAGKPFVMYCHPREFSLVPLSAAGIRSGRRERLTAAWTCFKWNIGRRKARRTIRRLLSEFRFTTLGRLATRVKALGDHQSLVSRDLSGS